MLFKTPSSYVIEADGLSKLSLLTKRYGDPGNIVLLTDRILFALYREKVEAAFGCPLRWLVVEAGEGAKSLQEAARCWERLIEWGASRDTLLLGLGGGAVGDLAGFVASTYMRGMGLALIPTTLLAMVDACIGGKNGVNLRGAKNGVGTFYQPQFCLIDPLCLQTLPDRQWRSGFAEVIKYGAIADAALFADLEALPACGSSLSLPLLAPIIRRCCELKLAFVKDDYEDAKGRRALLNFGHTFGHALEMLTSYETLTHGEAVAIGMSCACQLSEGLGLLQGEAGARVEALCRRFGLPTALPALDPRAIVAAMRKDKKNRGGVLHLVALESLGKARLVVGIEEVEVEKLLQAKMERDYLFSNKN